MSCVLDTNVFSALMRGEPGPVRRLLALAPGEVFVPQPVVAEIRYGIARLSRSRNRTLLEHKAEELLSALTRAPWTDDVSHRFGTIKADLERKGTRLDDFDVAIAAHALTMGAVLATRNVRHLERVSGLSVEDWRT